MAEAVHGFSLLFLSATSVILSSSTHDVLQWNSSVSMCRKLCQLSTGPFNFMKEDRSCRRIAIPVYVNKINIASGKSSSAKEEVMSTDKTSAVIQGWNHSDEKYLSNGTTQLKTETTPTKADVQCKDASFHQSCKEGNLTGVKQIVVQGLEDIDCRGSKGRTAIMEAALSGEGAVFDFLISRGCDLSAVDEDNNSVLHVSCIGGDVNIVRTVLDDNVTDIETKGKLDRTPVLTAAHYGQRNVFNFLVRRGCNLRYVTAENCTVLHSACCGGNIRIVKYILSLNIFSTDSRGKYEMTPVMSAISHGHAGVFHFLVSRGCNLSVFDHFNNSILHWACFGGNVGLVNYLISRGWFDLERRGFLGRTPLLTAVTSGEVKVAKLLLSTGCNVKTVDDEGNSISHVACIGGHLNMVRFLIKTDLMRPAEKNARGLTALEIAELHKFKGIVGILKT